MQPFDSTDETLQREVFLNKKHENMKAIADIQYEGHGVSGPHPQPDIITYILFKDFQETKAKHKSTAVLLKRERLLKHAESFLDGQEQFQVTLNSHWQQAKKRNKALLEDFKHYQTVFKERVEKPYSRNFVTLKEQYWSMVERELPGWKAEVKNSRRDTPSPR